VLPKPLETRSWKTSWPSWNDSSESSRELLAFLQLPAFSPLRRVGQTRGSPSQRLSHALRRPKGWLQARCYPSSSREFAQPERLRPEPASMEQWSPGVPRSLSVRWEPAGPVERGWLWMRTPGPRQSRGGRWFVRNAWLWSS
jgi:hypothetical protein